MITFFNVLDRCDHPLTILKGLKSQLKDLSSRVILTVPLPLYPSVEEGRYVQQVSESSTLAVRVCVSVTQISRNEVHAFNYLFYMRTITFTPNILIYIHTC